MKDIKVVVSVPVEVKVHAPDHETAVRKAYYRVQRDNLDIPSGYHPRVISTEEVT